jgi:hypothetical protein
MIHKRFNYGRHLVWACIFLTLFVSPAVTYNYKANNQAKQEFSNQPAVIQTVLVNAFVQK